MKSESSGHKCVYVFSTRVFPPRVKALSLPSIKSQLYNLSNEVHALSRSLKSDKNIWQTCGEEHSSLLGSVLNQKNNQLLTYLSLKLWHHLCFHHVQRVSCVKIGRGISNSNRPFRDIENSRVGILEWLLQLISPVSYFTQRQTVSSDFWIVSSRLAEKCQNMFVGKYVIKNNQ